MSQQNPRYNHTHSTDPLGYREFLCLLVSTGNIPLAYVCVCFSVCVVLSLSLSRSLSVSVCVRGGGEREREPEAKLQSRNTK